MCQGPTEAMQPPRVSSRLDRHQRSHIFWTNVLGSRIVSTGVLGSHRGCTYGLTYDRQSTMVSHRLAEHIGSHIVWTNVLRSHIGCTSVPGSHKLYIWSALIIQLDRLLWSHIDWTAILRFYRDQTGILPLSSISRVRNVLNEKQECSWYGCWDCHRLRVEPTDTFMVLETENLS